MIQSGALLVTVVGVLALAAVFLRVGTRASLPAEGPPADTDRLRVRLFAVLAIAFVPLTAWSLTKLPYDAPVSADGAVVVEAVGHQWYWELSRTEVPVGKPVSFQVTSADVNHGFAIYDDDLRILAQTQAMPGYVNRLEVVFPRPGAYRVLCLEYCGSVHHGMAAVLQAKEAN